jgi:hypothetical protein
MKNVLLITLLLTFTSYSQNNFSIDKDARIYDLPGEDFLTTVIINDKIVVKHYDGNGNIVWSDSLSFIPDISPVYNNKVARFKNTDEYILSAFADPTPETVFWQTLGNDTLVYQFTKLNLSSHTFTSSIVDTFSCKSVDLLELKDTSIYLFVADNSINTYPFNHATYSLNPSMEKSTIAPLDSITTYPFGWSFYVYGDSIYRYQSIDSYHAIHKYSTDISLVQTSYAYIYTNQDQSKEFFRRSINYDSIFVFTQGQTSGSNLIRWKMNWMDINLNTINTTEFDSPLTPNEISRYEITFNNVELDKINKRIFILGRDPYSMAGSGNSQKIFVYDYNFNLICEIPVIQGNDLINTLISLNDKVYLKVRNNFSEMLYEQSCEFLNLTIVPNKNRFKLFPNPTNSEIHISNSEYNKLSIILLSSDGKQLLKMAGMDPLIKIDLKDHATGIYFVKISDEFKSEVIRIIKE